MPWQSSWAVNFYSIIKYSYVYIIINAVISMYDCICNDFMNGVGWIYNRLKSAVSHYRDFLNYLYNLFYCICYLVVG